MFFVIIESLQFQNEKNKTEAYQVSKISPTFILAIELNWSWHANVLILSKYKNKLFTTKVKGLWFIFYAPIWSNHDMFSSVP